MCVDGMDSTEIQVLMGLEYLSNKPHFVIKIVGILIVCVRKPSN